MKPAGIVLDTQPVTLAELLALDGDITKHVGETAKTRRPLAWLLDPRIPRPDVLAFDLAKKGAWAFLGSTRREFGDVNATEARIEGKWIGDLERIVGEACTWSATGPLVVVEDTHLGSAENTPLAFAQITRYGAALAAVCAAQGVPMLRIPAGTWQRKLIGKHPREQGKALSLAHARKRFGSVITTEDMADAALLATFVRGGR